MRLERVARGQLQANRFNGGVALGWIREWLHRRSIPALRVDDGVALGTEQGAEQEVDDGVAVDVERTVCLDNILARCCGATAGTALQGDGVFFPREHVCVSF